MANILIVDDERNIRSGLQIAFEDEGYDTFEAADGKEAWKIINKNTIDLVITDLRMPVMSGYELLKKINAAYPTLPVIVLTGHGSIEDAVQAMRDGAVDFFTKPVDLDHLILTVSKALSNKLIKEQNEKLTKEISTLRKKQDFHQIIIVKTHQAVIDSGNKMLLIGCHHDMCSIYISGTQKSRSFLFPGSLSYNT